MTSIFLKAQFTPEITRDLYLVQRNSMLALGRMALLYGQGLLSPPPRNCSIQKLEKRYVSMAKTHFSDTGLIQKHVVTLLMQFFASKPPKRIEETLIPYYSIWVRTKDWKWDENREGILIPGLLFNHRRARWHLLLSDEKLATLHCFFPDSGPIEIYPEEGILFYAPYTKAKPLPWKCAPGQSLNC